MPLRHSDRLPPGRATLEALGAPDRRRASIGAVPLCRAKCPAVGNRLTSPTRPTMIAAVNGPIPWISVDGRRRRADRRRRCVCGPRHGRRRGNWISSSSCSAVATRSASSGPSACTVARSFSALVDCQRAACAALDQQTQQCVQPADRARPVGGDLTVAVSEQPQHDPVLVDSRRRRSALVCATPTIAAERASLGRWQYGGVKPFDSPEIVTRHHRRSVRVPGRRPESAILRVSAAMQSMFRPSLGTSDCFASTGRRFRARLSAAPPRLVAS